jgi:predicted MFS family arabinose efflux permease
VAQDHLVQEAFGPPLAPREAAGAIGLGVVSLLLAGVLPAILGALNAEGRIGASGIGTCAMVEALAVAFAAALAGILIPPKRLHWIGALASAALVAANLATLHASGTSVYVIRACAGIPEGVLLWLMVSMVARTELPERWSAVFFTALVTSQLVLALLGTYVMSRWGADGGFAMLAVASTPGIVFAFLAPDRYAPLPKPEGASGFPPLRGMVALVATLVFACANGAVAIYLQPLAHQAGLSANVARIALSASLAAQIAGGSAATVLAGRVQYFTVFVFTTVCFLAAWVLFGLSIPAWLFIAANALSGFAAVLMGPFLVPMTIEADPSRRAALQSASAQVLAGAAGPACAIFAVGEKDVRGVLLLGACLLLAGLAIIAGLHFSARRERASR